MNTPSLGVLLKNPSRGVLISGDGGNELKWILELTDWNDNGFWIDSKFWED